MHQMLAELDAEASYPINKKHIKAHTEITKVEWTEDKFEIQSFGVSLDWYSKEELWDFEV